MGFLWLPVTNLPKFNFKKVTAAIKKNVAFANPYCKAIEKDKLSKLKS